MFDWQPIATAPKDGTTILAWSEYCSEPVTVQWCKGRWCAAWDGEPVIEAMSDFGTYYKSGGPLSHWMPFPAAPSGDGLHDGEAR